MVNRVSQRLQIFCILEPISSGYPIHRGSPIPRGKEGEGAALTSWARFIEQRVTWRKPNLILTLILSPESD